MDLMPGKEQLFFLYIVAANFSIAGDNTGINLRYGVSRRLS